MFINSVYNITINTAFMKQQFVQMDIKTGAAVVSVHVRPNSYSGIATPYTIIAVMK